MALRLEDKKALVAEVNDVASTALSAIAAGYLPFSTGEVINVDGGFHLHRL